MQSNVTIHLFLINLPTHKIIFKETGTSYALFTSVVTRTWADVEHTVGIQLKNVVGMNGLLMLFCILKFYTLSVYLFYKVNPQESYETLLFMVVIVSLMLTV